METKKKKRVSTKARTKSDFFQIRIEPSVKADFEQVATDNIQVPSKLVSEWINDYITRNKYTYYLIEHKEIKALIKAVNEREAVYHLKRYLQKQEGVQDGVLTDSFNWAFDVMDCRKQSYEEAIFFFIKEWIQRKPLIPMDELLKYFNELEVVLFAEANFYYVTTQELLEFDVQKAYEERVKGLPRNLIDENHNC